MALAITSSRRATAMRMTFPGFLSAFMRATKSDRKPGWRSALSAAMYMARRRWRRPSPSRRLPWYLPDSCARGARPASDADLAAVDPAGLGQVRQDLGGGDRADAGDRAQQARVLGERRVAGDVRGDRLVERREAAFEPGDPGADVAQRQRVPGVAEAVLLLRHHALQLVAALAERAQLLPDGVAVRVRSRLALGPEAGEHARVDAIGLRAG